MLQGATSNEVDIGSTLLAAATADFQVKSIVRRITSQLRESTQPPQHLFGRFARNYGCQTAESHLFHDLCAKCNANVSQRARYMENCLYTNFRKGYSKAFEHAFTSQRALCSCRDFCRAPSMRTSSSHGTRMVKHSGSERIERLHVGDSLSSDHGGRL